MARPVLSLLLLLAALGSASASFQCPTASMDPASSCYCTSGCSINGDATDFPWNAPVYPPVAIDMGEDTVCATFVLPCTSATTTLLAFLGVTGNVQMDNNANNDVSLCSSGTQTVFHTAFTADECAAAATRFAAIEAAAPASTTYVAPVLCTSIDCNPVGSVGDTATSAAGRAGAAAGALALAAAAAAALI